MNRRTARERMRRKKRQMRRRKIIRLATYLVAMVLAVVFVVRGIIIPIANRISGKDESKSVEVQANISIDPDAAIRQPLKGQQDTAKVAYVAPGWHEDENGKWYQNADGTYYAGGLQDISGTKYCFNDNGYVQTGWVSKGIKDYYFNEDGSYDPTQKRKLLCLTFDDGPGQYTDDLLNCLEENNAHATFFMLGQNVANYPEQVQHILKAGCEIGSHSYDHPNLKNLDLDSVKKQFTDTDDLLIKACGQAATVARAPYGEWNQDIIDTVGKPFFTWSVDSRDWDYKDADLDYKSVMEGDLSDGSIILMHDIHQPTVEAAKRIIPELVAQGYKLVTVSEMAQAKGVTLQMASYSDFWQSSFDKGIIAGASSGGGDTSGESTDGNTDESGEQQE
ncbi:polysaccharide deacetylase family protein [Blautia glucerasea]|nr:polysaccharide deacetylase family protein [Blautia glucerasea]